MDLLVDVIDLNFFRNRGNFGADVKIMQYNTLINIECTDKIDLTKIITQTFNYNQNNKQTNNLLVINI